MRSKRKYIAFDIETTRILPAGGDWRSLRPLGIACAATWPVDSHHPLLWYGTSSRGHIADVMSPQDALELVKYLTDQIRRGYTIATWNGVGFDFDILAEESGALDECRNLAFNHVDMMFHALCQIGHGISLAAAAEGMELAGKSASWGTASTPIVWAEGRKQEVFDYVKNDARVTLELACLSESRRYLRWVTRGQNVGQMPLPDGWLVAKLANKLQKATRGWQRNKWSREKLTAWIRP